MKPDLKTPSTEMPYKCSSQQTFARVLIEEYKEAGIYPNQTFIQILNINDLRYCLKKHLHTPSKRCSLKRAKASSIQHQQTGSCVLPS